MLAQWLDGVDLTAEQKEKVEALKLEVGRKLAEVNKKIQELFTQEQRKLRAEIATKGKAEGKTPQEIRKLQDEAVELTPEQKEKFAELMGMRREIHEQLAKRLLDILTPEQKQIVEPRVAKTLKAAAKEQKPPKKRETPPEKKEPKRAQQQQS